MVQRYYSADALLELKDAGAITASAAAQVGGSDQILDLGQALFPGIVIVDVSAIEVATDELYHIITQFSSDSGFASDIENGPMLELGHTSVRKGSAINSTVGRYELPFANEQDEVVRRYMRLYTHVAGTISTGINYKAFAARLYGT